MSDVLVLFYDDKDRQRPVGKSTLEDEIKRGFNETKISYDIQVASPSHTPWLAKFWMNEKKYDGILVVAGLACSLSVPYSSMQDLYKNETIVIGDPDWPEIDKKIVPSKYYNQQRHVPILGLPTRHAQDDGQLAFKSMIMESSPSDAMCVGIEQGYQSARLMSKLIKNEFREVKLIIPDQTGMYNRAAHHVNKLLNLEFKVWDQGKPEDKIWFPPPVPIADYLRRVETFKENYDNVLPVVFYDDFSQIKEVDKVAEFIIGVYCPQDEPNWEHVARLALSSAQLEHVIHVRPSTEENAAMAVAQCLYNSRNKKGDLKLTQASYFRQRRRDKAMTNVEELLKLHPELDKRKKK